MTTSVDFLLADERFVKLEYAMARYLDDRVPKEKAVLRAARKLIRAWHERRMTSDEIREYVKRRQTAFDELEKAIAVFDAPQ